MTNLYMHLAKEVIETAKEIIMEEKIHITETEEVIEEEIPAPVKEVSLKTVANDGKDSPKVHLTSLLYSLSCYSEPKLS